MHGNMNVKLAKWQFGITIWLHIQATMLKSSWMTDDSMSGATN